MPWFVSAADPSAALPSVMPSIFNPSSSAAPEGDQVSCLLCGSVSVSVYHVDHFESVSVTSQFSYFNGHVFPILEK